MAKPFSVLQQKMSPERRRRIANNVKRTLAIGDQLDELTEKLIERYKLVLNDEARIVVTKAIKQGMIVGEDADAWTTLFEAYVDVNEHGEV